MGKSSINGPFSTAMLNNQRVYYTDVLICCSSVYPAPPADAGAATLKMGSAWAPAGRPGRSSVRLGWDSLANVAETHGILDDSHDSFSKTLYEFNISLSGFKWFFTMFYQGFHHLHNVLPVVFTWFDCSFGEQDARSQPGSGSTGDPWDHRGELHPYGPYIHTLHYHNNHIDYIDNNNNRYMVINGY